MARNAPEPTPRLNHSRILTFFGLDPAEMVAVGLVSGILPLVALGTDLPTLPWKIGAAAAWFSWGILLFIVRRDELSAFGWMSRMVPFWLRQRRFRSVSARARVSPMHDLVGPSTSKGVNALSLAWTTDPDGVRELHVYEERTRPYRAWVGVADRDLPVRTMLMLPVPEPADG